METMMSFADYTEYVPGQKSGFADYTEHVSGQKNGFAVTTEVGNFDNFSSNFGNFDNFKKENKTDARRAIGRDDGSVGRVEANRPERGV